MKAICPGGMMTCSSAEVMRAAGYVRDSVHTDGATMASVAAGIAAVTGLDNVGVPFCMTVEAEAMGAPVDLGSVDVEPLVTGYAFTSAAALAAGCAAVPVTDGRMPAVIEAVRLLSAGSPMLITGSVVGPVSLATSLVEPGDFFRAMLESPDTAHAALDVCTETIERFAVALCAAGAGVIVVAEPSGTGEILGPAWFREFVAPRLARINRAVLAEGSEVVVHVCGDVRTIVDVMREVPMTAFSFDSLVDVAEMRALWPDGRFMGNVSTALLDRGTPERIDLAVAGVRYRGIDIVAPACGIATSTPLANVAAMAMAAHKQGV